MPIGYPAGMSLRNSVVCRLGLAALIASCLALPRGVTAQLNLPQIVQLPTQDFVYSWGETRPIDDLDRPEFNLRGVEASFRCTATGNFKPGSHMRDYYNLRDFEQSLTGSIYFIQDVTYRLNQLYLSNDLQWAILNCIIPVTVEPEDAVQEKLDKAVEKAQRDRERRREREARSAE